MPNNPYLTRYKVTCPDCKRYHYTFKPDICPRCDADLGGRGFISLPEFCEATINALTGEIKVRPEWE